MGQANQPKMTVTRLLRLSRNVKVTQKQVDEFIKRLRDSEAKMLSQDIDLDKKYDI